MKKYVRFVIILLSIAILSTCSALGEAVSEQSQVSAGLEVYFLDLGRVDAILIRADGQTCFIDVGFEADAKPAMRFVRALGIEHLDCYIGTHGHYDHIEGAPEIIEAFRPDKIYISHIGCLSAMLECAEESQKEIISATERILLQPGDSFPLGRGYLTCMGPLSIRQCFTGSSHENDNSLIMRLDYGQRSMLFTGDTTDRVLREVDKAYPGRLRVDVLKNPHHNGAHDEDVIDLIQPRYVVFCTDDRNQPKQSYMEALAARNIRTLLTGPDNQGSIGILSDGENLEFRCGTAVQSIAIAPPAQMYPGQDLALTTVTDPADALVPDRQLGWNSSDESVAQVWKGVVRAVAPGVATITAEAINGAAASMEVQVFSACVRMDQTSMKLAVGETRRITGAVEPSGVEDVTGEWLTSDPNVATVSGGKVTGVGEGTAQIVARLSNGASCSCEVTVRGTLARSVRLDRSKATMQVGDSLTLSAKVKPAEYDLENLEWFSSDESILWVDQYGNVTGVGKGKAKITVVASSGVTDVCTIKVNE